MNGKLCSLLFFILVCSCNLQLTLQLSEAQTDIPVRPQSQGQSSLEVYSETNTDAVDGIYDDNAYLNKSYENEGSSHQSDIDGVDSDRRRNENSTSNDESSNTFKDGANDTIFHSSITQLPLTQVTISSNAEVLVTTEEAATSDLDDDFHPGESTPPTSGVYVDPTTEPASETHETVDSQPASETHETVDGQPASETHKTVDGRPASETHETVDDQPASETHETVDSQPASETHETVDDQPASETHETVDGQPASETHETVDSQPAPETHKTVDDQPASETHETVDSQPASEIHETIDSQPASEIHETVDGQPASETHETVDGQHTTTYIFGEGDSSNNKDSAADNKETSIVELKEDEVYSSDGKIGLQDDSFTEKKDTPDDHVGDTVDSGIDIKDFGIVDSKDDGVVNTEVDNISDSKDGEIKDKDHIKTEDLADEESKSPLIGEVVGATEGDGQNGQRDEHFEEDTNDTTVISTCPCDAPSTRTNRNNKCFFHLQSLKTLFKEYKDFIYTASGDLYAAPSDSYYKYNSDGNTEDNTSQKGKYLKLEVNTISCDDDKKEITIEYPKFRLKDTGELELTAPGMEQTVPRGSYCLLQESRGMPRRNPGPVPIRVRMCAKLRKFPRCCAPGSSMTYDGCQPSSFRQPFRPPVTLLPNPVPEPLEAIDEVLQELKCDHEPLAGVELEPETVNILAPPLNNNLAIMRKVVGQWNIITDSFCIDGSQKENGEALYSVFLCRISQNYVKEQCAHDLCLRKCCPEGMVYNTSAYKCVDSEKSFKPVLTSGSLEDYKVIMGYPVCADYHLDSSTVINVDGSLNYGPRKLAMHEYCTDTFLRPNKRLMTGNEKERSYVSYTASLVCFREATGWELHRFTVFSVCLSISVFFLIITIFCHLSTPALRTSHHRYTLSHMISLLLGNIFLVVAQIGHNSLGEKTCVVIAFLIHLTYLATFSWLNVMCFDIWWLARQQTRKHLVRREESSGWLHYCICAVYGWGAPFASSLVAAVIFNAPNTTLIKPDFGVKCFFNGDLPILTYFYGPIAVMFIVSLALLFLSFRYKSAMNTMTKDSQGRFHIKAIGVSRAKWSLWKTKKKKKTSETNEGQRDTAEEACQEARSTAPDSGVYGQESPPTSLPTDPPECSPSEPMRVHSKVNFRVEFWRQVTLFTLMVLCWVTEVISFAVGLPEIWILTDVLNSIQGFFIFILFARNVKKRNLFLSANPWCAKCFKSLGLCGQDLRRRMSTITSYASSRSTNTWFRNAPDTVPGLRGRKKEGMHLTIKNNTNNPNWSNQCISLRSQTSNRTLISMLSTESSASSTSASELTMTTPTDTPTPDFVGVTFDVGGGRNLHVVEEEV